MARVEITPEAELDLENIARYIAEDNLPRALSFADELQNACMELAVNPARFSMLSGYEELGVRRRVFGNYLIIFRVTGKIVVVLRIVHGSMDHKQLF